MKVFIFMAIFMLLSGSVFASTNSGVTYAGRLLTPAGVPVEANNVKFTFEIRSAGSEDCLLYREQQAVNMSGSNGLFTVTMNDGTGVPTTYGYAFEKVFANNQSFTLPGGNCASGTTYAPSATDGRKLRVYFNDGTFSGWEPLPIMAINYIPMSLTAKNVGGFESGNLLRVENAGVPGTGAALTSSDLTKLLDLIAGTSTQYAPIAAASALSLPTYPGTPTTPAAGSTWYDSSTNQIKFWNGSAVQTLGVSGAGITSLVAGTGLNVGAGPGGTITTSGTLNIDVGTTANKIVQLDGSARLPAVDGSQLTGLTASQVPNLDVAKITSGTLPVARGGTGLSTASNNAFLTTNGTGTPAWTAPGTSTVLISNASNVLTGVGTATTGALLQMQAGGIPAFTTASFPTTTTANRILYSSATNIVSELATANNAILTTNGAGVPSWGALSSDVFTQYVILAGRAGGQNIRGGIAPSENLTLESTSDATKGNVILQPNGGNVGIGTISPQVPLEVNGQVNVSNGFLDIFSNSNSAGTNYALTFARSRGTYAVPTASQSGDGLGYVNWAGHDGTNYVGAGRIQLLQVGSTSIGTPSDMAFSTGNSSGVIERLRIASTGNVGLGTTSPTAALHLKAGTAAVNTSPLKFSAGTNLTTPENGAVEFDGTDLFFTSGGVRRTLASSSSGTLTGNISTINNTGGSITMTPSAGNSVIVNQSTVSTSPSTGALIVNGGAGISGALNVAGNITGAANITATTAMYSPVIYGGTTASQTLTLDSTSNATKGNIFLAPNGGNVGIGTTSPGRILHLSHPTMATFLLQNPTLPSGNQTSSIYTSGIDGSLNFGRFNDTGTTNTRTDLTISATNGNVGIGNGNPANILSVGNNPSPDAYGRNTLDIFSSTGSVVQASGPNGKAMVWYDSPGRTMYVENRITTAGVNPIVYAAGSHSFMNGNVGIGTSTPSRPLEVKGDNSFLVRIDRDSASTRKAGIEFFQQGVANWWVGPDINDINVQSFSIYDTRAASTRFHIDNNGNVGIGTTTPQYLLHLSAGTGGAYQRIERPAGQFGILQFTTLGSNRRFEIGVDNVAESGSNAGSNFGIWRFDDAGVQQGPALSVVRSTGNVGIGTTSPSFPLTTNGQVAGYFDSSTSHSIGTAGLILYNAAGDRGLSLGTVNSASDYSLVQAGGGGVGRNLAINPNGGNVGIGTTSPQRSLHIASSGSSATMILDAQTAGAGLTKRFMNNNGGSQMFGKFADDMSSSSTQMVIDTDGKVGIGTLSPFAPLHVQGASVVGETLRLSNGSGGEGGQISLMDAAGVGGWEIDNNGTGAASYLRIFRDKGVSNVNAMMIGSTGNVGIGTENSAPSTMLQVDAPFGNETLRSHRYVGSNSWGNTMRLRQARGTLAAPSPTVNGDPLAQILFGGHDGTGFVDTASVYAVSTGAVSTGSIPTDLLFSVGSSGGGVERMRISSAGNLGIGTSNPGNKLHVHAVASSLPSDAHIKLTNTVNSNVSFLATDSNGFLRLAGTAGVALGYTNNTNFTEVLRADWSTGNVGINTLNPSERLHVVGNLRVQGSTDCTLGNGSGGTSCSSDARLKTNIEEIENPLGKILSLRGVEFDWNEKSQNPGKHAIGVIAQDIERQFPTAVIEDPNTGYKKVDYAVLVAPIIQAFKELNEKILTLFRLSEAQVREIASVKSTFENQLQQLEAKNKQLQQDNATKTKELEELKARLDRIEKMLNSK